MAVTSVMRTDRGLIPALWGYRPRMERRAGSAGVLLRCYGCGCTATADRISANRLAEMISWHRAPDGDWCLICQWRRGHTPRCVARLYGDMRRRRVAHPPAERDKVESIWATIRRYGV